MDPRPSQRHVLGRLAVPVMVAVGLFASMLAASAASLGVSAGSLFTQEIEVSIEVPNPPKEPIVSTDFSGCSSFVDGWTDESGHTWTSQSGDWQCLGSDVVRAQQRVPLANLTVDVARTTDLLVSTEISDISHQNNRSGPGLSLLATSSGEYLYVVYERDNEQLIIGVNGVSLTTYVNVGDFDSVNISVTISDGQLAVQLGDDAYSPVPIPAGFDNPWFGLVSDDDNQSRFTSFTIEDLS